MKYVFPRKEKTWNIGTIHSLRPWSIIVEITLFFALFTLFLSPSLHANEPFNIVVLQLKTQNIESADIETETLNQNIESELLHISIISPRMRSEIAESLHISLDKIACTNSALQNKIRRTFNVDYFICASIEQEMNKSLIEIRLIRASDFHLVTEVRQGCRRCDYPQLQKAISQITRTLIRKFIDNNRAVFQKHFPDLQIDQYIDSLRQGRPFFINPQKPEAEPSPDEYSETVAADSDLQSISEVEVQAISLPTESLPQTKSEVIENEGNDGDNDSLVSKSISEDITVLDFEKANSLARPDRDNLLMVLVFFMICIILALIILNYYKKRRFDIQSSSSIITLNELEESEFPAGILRCSLKYKESDYEAYIFAPSAVIIGHDPSEFEDSQKPHLNINLLPAIGENVNRSKAIDKRHAKIDFNRSAVYLTDLGSRGGTFLNNQKCEPGNSYSLSDNDRIGLAGVLELQVVLHTDRSGRITSIFLKRLNNAEKKVLYIFLLTDTYFSLSENFQFEWNAEEGVDSFFRIFFRTRNFWLQAICDHPQVILDSERLPKGAKRRLNQLHSTIELQKVTLLIDDLTVTL